MQLCTEIQAQNVYVAKRYEHNSFEGFCCISTCHTKLNNSTNDWHISHYRGWKKYRISLRWGQCHGHVLHNYSFLEWFSSMKTNFPNFPKPRKTQTWAWTKSANTFRFFRNLSLSLKRMWHDQGTTLSSIGWHVLNVKQLLLGCPDSSPCRACTPCMEAVSWAANQGQFKPVALGGTAFSLCTSIPVWPPSVSYPNKS